MFETSGSSSFGDAMVLDRSCLEHESQLPTGISTFRQKSLSGKVNPVRISSASVHEVSR
jgi:hypothetical protein